MEDIIKIENLCYSYMGDEDTEPTPVLKNIDFTVTQGEFVAVLGHNGSGKSTLAKHLNAILLPTSGKVTVDGIDTSDENKLYDLRQRVGMVFQNPDNQMVATIAEEDVAFAPENLGLPSEEIQKRVDYALDAVNMTKFKNHAPHMLSGGQKQRIAIAGVLAMEPDVIVLDEPTAMLDPSGRAEVMQTIKRLNKEKNITVVLITHYMDEAVQADRVVIIDKGEIKMQGIPRDIFPQVSKLKSFGLDTPQSTILASILKKEICDLDENVLNAKECTDTILRALREKM